MKRVLLACAVWSALLGVVSAANAASDRLNDLQLSIVKVEASGEIRVRMANASHKDPLKIWTEANSWGVHCVGRL